MKRVLCITLVVLISLVTIEAKEKKEQETVRFYSLEKEYVRKQTKEFKFKLAKAIEIKPIVEPMLSIYGSIYVNEKDNTIFITDTSEMVKEISSVIKRLDVPGLEAGGNLESKVIQLKYQSASDIKALIQHKLSKDGVIGSIGYANGFVVTDITSKIREVEKLVQTLDIKAVHIGIDVTAIEYNVESLSKVGIDALELLRQPLELSMSMSSESAIKTVLDGQFNISELIDTLQKDGGGTVLARTTLVTKNNKYGVIETMERVPGLITNGNNQTYKELTGFRLSVQPLVMESGYISLNVKPYIIDLTGWTPKGEPLTFLRTMQTEVVVKSGDHFVLGGLQKSEKVSVRKGVPVLSWIPIVNLLFSQNTDVKVTRDVLIVIRPYILGIDSPLSELDGKKMKAFEQEFSD